MRLEADGCSSRGHPKKRYIDSTLWCNFDQRTGRCAKAYCPARFSTRGLLLFSKKNRAGFTLPGEFRVLWG